MQMTWFSALIQLQDSQTLIDSLYKFCKRWHLIVSLSKTNVLVTGKGETSYDFKFGDRIIEMSKEYKYLGTIFSTDKNMLKKNHTNLIEKQEMLSFLLTHMWNQW